MIEISTASSISVLHKSLINITEQKSKGPAGYTSRFRTGIQRSVVSFAVL